MQDIIQMCSFEGTKSTKGASKMRRDLINSEISQLRDLLPLPPSTRQRLSQLQLMALVCVYVRKSNYFQQVLKHQKHAENETPNIGFSKALNGFIMMMTQGGKLLFISDNAAEYLGHSMEDLLIHGDSVFDIIDKQDHASVQSELVRGTQPSIPTEEERLFLCRMNVSRNARRQMRFGDQKVVLVQGHYLSYLPLCSRNEPVFLAHCTPVAMPETRECVVQGATNVFTSVHTLDMKFISIDSNGEFYLGYETSSLVGISWYHLVHPENMKEAQAKHRLITSSEQDRSCILLLRLQSTNGSWRWVHCVLQVKDSGDVSTSTVTASTSSTNTQQQPSQQPQQQQSQQTTVGQQPVIVATNQVLSEKEASVLRSNAWLYHYYAMQSKLQYGISYDTHTQRVHPYYPQVMPYQDPNSHYMATSVNNGSIHSSAIAAGPASTYSFTATSPYFQPYPHPYSMRLHHAFDYSRDSAWGYYESGTSSDLSSLHSYHSTNFQHSNIQQQQQYHQHQQQNQQLQQQQQTLPTTNSPSQSVQRPSKRSSPAKSSPRRSPSTPNTPQGSETSGGVAVIAPVAVRASTTLTTSLKNLNTELDEVENSYLKGSPTQEVPEQYEYPYFTPPYPSTPTNLTPFHFDSPEAKATHHKDQRIVPSIEPTEGRWVNEVSLKSPWLPSEEITGPLRLLNHI